MTTAGSSRGGGGDLEEGVSEAQQHQEWELQECQGNSWQNAEVMTVSEQPATAYTSHPWPLQLQHLQVHNIV